MNRKELILHLIGEISNYLLDNHPRRMVVSMHQEEDGLHLSFLDDHPHGPEEIERIERVLNSRKRPELAGYYGAMTGHDMLGESRLNLLGWQVKRCDVSRTQSGIRIDIWLGGERFECEQFTLQQDVED
jgi:hypothetical protein